jgi:hydrogenase maturation protein HypF
LLLRQIGAPVIATSGNVSDEPICIDEHEALARLAGMADLFLVHDRPIARHVDDSIVQVVLGREMMLRRARGYAPLPLTLKSPAPPALAMGAHLKNTVALAHGCDVFVSQHIGDLETLAAHAAFRRTAADLPALYGVEPALVACDTHPDYLSTQEAQSSGLPLVQVQHHYAHALACMAENELDPPLLAIAWDGSGHGPDGTVWGGECLWITPDGYERAAHLRTFPLPGGEQAVREPRRSALGALHELYGAAVFGAEGLPGLPILRQFTLQEVAILKTMLERRLQCPMTSSAGRLFDAVAALCGLRAKLQYESQAAMELQFAAEAVEEARAYPFESTRAPDGASDALRLDWGPGIEAILNDLACKVSVEMVAARFHNMLAEMIVAVARARSARKIALAGGCFQNRVLLTQAVHRLSAAGFEPYWPQRFPAGDGAISLGQIAAVAKLHAASESRNLKLET